MASYYWGNGGSGGGTWNNASATNWWLDATRLVPAVVAPTSADDVFIDTSSNTGIITCTGALCNNLTVTASQAVTLGDSGSTLTISGNLSLPSGGSFSVAVATWTITFNATTTGKTITTNGKSLVNLTFNGVGGGWTLQDALTANSNARTLTLTNGSFDANGFAVTYGLLSSSNSNTRTLTLGNGLWTLTGTGSVWNLSTTTGLTFNKGTSDILLSATSIATRTFGSGGLTYNKLTIGGGGTSITSVSGGGTISEIASTKTVAHTIQFGAGTQTFTTWSVTGTAGKVVTVNSSTAGTRRTINLTNVTSGIDYLSVKDIGITNTNTFYVGANSTDGGNNLNVYFTASPVSAANGNFFFFM